LEARKIGRQSAYCDGHSDQTLLFRVRTAGVSLADFFRLSLKPPKNVGNSDRNVKPSWQMLPAAQACDQIKQVHDGPAQLVNDGRQELCRGQSDGGVRGRRAVIIMVHGDLHWIGFVYVRHVRRTTIRENRYFRMPALSVLDGLHRRH
jgi:hypothetical protein